ncbi:MAG: YIP1 family protein [Paracoccus sp. (in: a-proteobacteria)]|uniref:YIP1 family protein n=1 Tax=Paracoccus sp. TaxID=267 RepID=UPI0039E34006
MRLGEIGDLMVLTLRDPALAVQAMRRVDPPVPARWMVLALAVCFSTLLAGLARVIFPLSGGDPLSQILSRPWALAAVQFAALVISAGAVTVIGRAFGGKGRFDEALLLIAWVELILVGLQAVQLLFLLVFPASGSIMSMLAFALSIYLTVSLTKALHGFRSTPKVALGFIGGIFVVGFLLSILAAAFGILPEVTP